MEVHGLHIKIVKAKAVVTYKEHKKAAQKKAREDARALHTATKARAQ